LRDAGRHSSDCGASRTRGFVLRARRYALQGAHRLEVRRTGVLRTVVHAVARSTRCVRREHAAGSDRYGDLGALQRQCLGRQPAIGALALSHGPFVVHHGRELRPERRCGIHSDSWSAFAFAGSDSGAEEHNRKGRKGREEVAEQHRKSSRGDPVKMWSGRFRQPLDPAFEAWQRSWEFDCRLLECELEASSAHARALAKAGVLSADELKATLDGLEQIGERVAEEPDLLEDDEAEDVHHFVEKALVTIVGDLGYKLHSGRSRNEQIATDLRLYTRAACDEISAELSKLTSAFLDRAEKAGDAAMPAYTHLQRAEPVLVAHWLLAYAE